MKSNDWIVASLNNPDFTNQDFKDILGMTEDNTQMLPKEDYEQSDFIKNAFSKEDGAFDKDAFETFYNDKLQKFAEFNTLDPLVDNFEYSLFDTRQRATSRIKDPEFKLSRVTNPDRISVGISGRNAIGERKFTPSELAQTQKIFDTATGEFLNETPNDNALVNNLKGWAKSIFDDTLVLAQYEEDGEHLNPFTGQYEHHNAGDYKLNSEGEYYTEKLNGRSPIGKQVVSAFDLLSVDGEGINKYDFIDSDSLDKSVTGSIAKAALKVAPLFIPYVNTVYSWALVGREFSKALPMLYGMASSLFGNVEDSKALNSIAAFGQKMTTGTSEYAKQKTFAFENFANLLSDVATQWGQQKAIASAINKLRGSKSVMDEATKKAAQLYRTESQRLISNVAEGKAGEEAIRYIGDPEKWAESALGKAALKKYLPEAERLLQRNSRLGADASLAYMAIISNTDVYDSLLEHGANKRDAALVAFGSTLGMFGVDKYLHLGELFFDDLTADSERAIRATFRKEADSWANALVADGINNAEKTAKTKIGAWVNKGINLGKKATNKYIEDLKYHSTGFLGKAIGEGTEEVAEELVTDLSKQFYEIAGSFGPNFFNKSAITDVGAWENMGERYLMNFLGGAAGGGIFYGVDVVQNGKFTRNTSDDDLIYLVSNHKTPELLKELEKWRKDGKFGSKNLSASKFETKDGKRVYLTTDDEADSQNEFVYNKIKDNIYQLENILSVNKVNLSEDELFEQMVLGEDRFMALKNELQDVSYSTGYQQEFRNLTRDLVQAQQDYDAASNSVDGTPTGAVMSDADRRNAAIINNDSRTNNLKKLGVKLANLRAERDAFITGAKSLEYTDKMLFAIDPRLRQPFISMTYEDWVKANKNKDLAELTAQEKETYTQEYLEYKKAKQSADLTEQYEIYKTIKAKVDPYLAGLAENAGNYKPISEKLLSLFAPDGPLVSFNTLKWDDRLEGIETDEEFANKDTLLPGETEEDFAIRKNNRINKIAQANQLAMQTLYQQVQDIITQSGGAIDPSTQRIIHQMFVERAKDITDNIIKTYLQRANSFAQPIGIDNFAMIKKNIHDVIKTLKADGSNENEIRDKVKELLTNPIKDDLIKRQKMVQGFREGLIEMFDAFGFKYDPNNITGDTLDTFMQELAVKVANQDDATKHIFDTIGRSELWDQLQSVENLDEELLSTDAIVNGKDGFLERFFGEESKTYNEGLAYFDAGNIEELNQLLLTLRDTENKEDIEYNVKSDEEISKEVDEMAELLIDEYQRLISDLKNGLNSNYSLKLFNLVDSSVQNINPINDLLKNVTKQVLGNSTDVEQILQRLSDKVNDLESKDDFTLSDVDENDLRQTQYILELTKAYLYAASTSPNYVNPVGHNVTINEFAKHHSDVYPDFKELPSLSEDVATMYINEINKYLVEIAEESPYSWIALSNKNRINKRQKFINADKAFTKAKVDFFNTNRDAFKGFSINGRTVDLLEGIEALDDSDPDVFVHKAEDLLYLNVHKLLASGVSFTDILKSSKLIENITNIKNIGSQLTADLDDKISYDKLTDFDKAIYLFTVLGISSNDFNFYIKERIEGEDKIAPLTVQQHASRVVLAQIQHPNIFAEGLQYIADITGDTRGILKNYVFVDGSAGAGKTQAVARNAAKYIKDTEKIWLVAPKDTQATVLKEVVGRGDVFVRDSSSESSGSLPGIFDKIIDKNTYLDIMKDVDSNKTVSKYYSVKAIPGMKATKAFVLNPDSLVFNTVETPKLIIIDEATHFSSIEHQILDTWAQKNGITILALGDSNQNGYDKAARNLDREVIIAARTPKLAISLRDNNIQKQDNLTKIVTALNKLQSLETTDPEYDAKVKAIRKALGDFNFKVYNQEVVNGDLIIPKLTQDILDKIPEPKEGTKIGYVGKSAETYTLLSERFGDKVKKLDETAIQGQEFDYVIVDKDWKIDESDIGLLLFLQDLYTMMSRGRVGSILIDNGLSDIIGKNKEEFNKAMAPNLRDAIQPFKESALATIETLDLVSPEEFNKGLKPSSPTPSPTPTPSSAAATIEATLGSLGIDEESRDAHMYNTDGSVTLSKPEAQAVFREQHPDWTETTNSDGSITFTPPVIIDSEEYSGISDIEDIDAAESSNFSENTEEMLKELDAEGMADLENSMLDSEIESNETPLRVYGSAHLNGLVVAENKAGETIWLNPSADFSKYDLKDSVTVTPHSGKRDLEIFMDKDVITTPEEKDAIVRKLLDLKSAILYKHPYEEVSSSTSAVISKEDFDNIKYKIEVRRQDKYTDKFVGGTGLSENRMSINGLVYAIVAEIGDKSVTLGLMANPDTYEKAVPELMNRIDQTIAKIPEDDPNRESKIAKLREKQSTTIPDHVRQYKELVNLLAKKFNESGKDSYTVSVDPSFSGLTYIRRSSTSNGGRTAISKKPLTRYGNDPMPSFEGTHSYSVISSPYIYVGSGFKGISDVNRGKAVVFVSNDTLLSPDSLIQKYIEEKEATNMENKDPFHLSVAPRVRMLILEPKGVSFKSLTYTKKLSDLYKTELATSSGLVIVKSMPFEEDYMGARMFTSLWNWRANLQIFKAAYDKFKTDNGFTDADVTRITRYANAKYYSSVGYEDSMSTAVQEALRNTATDEEIKKVQDFNDSLASKARQFRIGGSMNGKGFYLGKLTNITKDNAFYGSAKSDPIGIYLEPDKIDTFYKMTDVIFSNFLDKFITLESSDGHKWETDRLITTKKNGTSLYQNSLSGLLREAFAPGSNGIILEEDGRQFQINMPSKRATAFVPIVLRELYKRVRQYQDEGSDFDPYPIKITGKEKEDGTKEEDIILNGFTSLTNLVKPGVGENFDSALDDMLALAFHGTTAKVESNSIRATDAYFKHGFFADPMGSTTVITNTAQGAMFKPLLNNSALFTVDCEIDMPVFDVQISKVRESILNPDTKVEVLSSKENAEINDLYSKGLLTDYDVLELRKVQSLEEYEEVLENKMHSAIRAKQQTNVNDNENLASVLNSVCNFDSSTHNIQTVKQYIKATLDRDVDETFNSSWDYNKLRIYLSDTENVVLSWNLISGRIRAELETRAKIEVKPDESPANAVLQRCSEAIESWKESLDQKVLDDLLEDEDVGNMLSTYLEHSSTFTSKNDFLQPITTMYEMTLDTNLGELLDSLTKIRDC